MTGDAGVYFRFLIAALATWRLAFLLARESGPWDVVGRFRRAGIGGRALTCVKCVGLWVAVPFALFVGGERWELVITWLALGGVVALIDEWTRPPFEWQPGPDNNRAREDADGSDERLADRLNRRAAP